MALNKKWQHAIVRVAICCASFTAFDLAAAPAETAPGGLVWQIDGPKGRVFLVGSMHLLRRDRPTLPAVIESAYREAESLVMEIDVDAVADEAMAALLLQTATYADDRKLPQVIGKARWRKLRPVLARVNVPEGFAETLEPWGIAMLLTTLEYSRLGFDPEIGVEKQLQNLAARDRKSIDGLETVEFQLGLLDALPAAEQLQLLDMTVKDIDDMPKAVDELYFAWRAGDLQRLDNLLLEGYRDLPRLYADLVERRNRNWLPQLHALLEREGDTLVVVGALHLVGDRGLLRLLETDGLKVVPYQPAKTPP